MFVQGRQRHFLKSVLYLQSFFFFFCIKKCDHYWFLDVLVAITVVAAKAFYGRGEGVGTR